MLAVLNSPNPELLKKRPFDDINYDCQSPFQRRFAFECKPRETKKPKLMFGGEANENLFGNHNNENNNENQELNIIQSRKRSLEISDSYDDIENCMNNNNNSTKKIKTSSPPRISQTTNFHKDWVTEFLPPNMIEHFLQANPEDKLFNEYEVRLILNKAIEQTKEKVKQEYEEVEKQLRAEQYANFSSTREVLNPTQNTSFNYIM